MQIVRFRIEINVKSFHADLAFKKLVSKKVTQPREVGLGQIPCVTVYTDDLSCRGSTIPIRAVLK